MRRARRHGATSGAALDLFAGCGGLSLGMRSAGFAILGGIERDATAAATHGANFHPGDKAHAAARDVMTAPDRLLAAWELDPGTKVDVLVGGPPCQAFARIGRAKLRAEATRRAGKAVDAAAWLRDPRASLHRRYLAYVDALRPDAILMENVPDVLNHGGSNIVESVCEALHEHGYDAAYTLLNAAHFGVPQMRERMFLIGFRRELRIGRIRFPAPTHHHELPRGYSGTRNCALRGVQGELFDGRSRYCAPPEPGKGLPPAVTAAAALADLPVLAAERMLAAGALRRGARRLDEPMPYSRPSATAYARLMREWPGFAAEAATAHVIRCLPRDYGTFARMRPGDQYPEALAAARARLAEFLAAMPRPPKAGSQAWRELERRFVPPYDAGKFPNKWRKMEADAPARTLMAHLGKDGYSHIHPDSAQARTISVREAARLQSFPDGFRFCGSMNEGFRQIGNAVPPLLAYALARSIREQLGLPLAPDFRRRLGLLGSLRKQARATPGRADCQRGS